MFNEARTRLAKQIETRDEAKAIEQAKAVELAQAAALQGCARGARRPSSLLMGEDEDQEFDTPEANVAKSSKRRRKSPVT